MADIELVVKVPEEIYKDLMAYYRERPNDFKSANYFERLVLNGKPIPKGHGDLIDRRELKKEVYTTTEWNGDIHRIIYEASIDDAKPIIEADTEDKEQEEERKNEYGRYSD